ncbi:MAG TPA: amino acid adenylation domain-containing protein [Ktedonobacteraceae bacterium]|nr:amino acid adenylation domain-containing protein [Ktedonobacteraceae bacterium]
MNDNLSQKQGGGLTAEQAELLAYLLEEEGITTFPAGVSIQQRPQKLPLSFAQQRLWFISQLAPDNSRYHIREIMRIRKGLHVAVFTRVFEELIRRHEILRTNFVVIEDEPVQVIHEPYPLQLPVCDLCTLPPAEREAVALSTVAAEVQRPFNLAYDRLMRILLIKLDQDDYIVSLVFHHIIADGWSMGVLLQEFLALYDAFLQGQTPPLPELPLQYADYTLWQQNWLQSELTESQLTYWRRQLADAPQFISLPTRHSGAQGEDAAAREFFQLSAELTAALETLCQQEGVTLFMVLLAAFTVLLTVYGGQQDILIGSPVANRTRKEFEGLIGLFANMVVLRTDLRGDPSWRELLGRVREVALGAYSNQDLPFERLVTELQPERTLHTNPFFQVTFSWVIWEELRGRALSTGEQVGMYVSQLEVEGGEAAFDLNLFAWKQRDEVYGFFEYRLALFDQPQIAMMAKHLLTILHHFVINPHQRLSHLCLLSAAERQQIVVAWNDTHQHYPQGQYVHHIFAAQTATTPDAIALAYEDQQLSYEALDRQAHCLAHYLQERQVGPEVYVGLCLERSLDLLISILGILKAGGAYVPLDPGSPAERLVLMLSDAHISLLLTQSHLRDRLPSFSGTTICMDEIQQEMLHQSSEPLVERIRGANLAYVIYTSGSSGRPKGVMSTHEGLINRLFWMQNTFQLTGEDRVLQKTPTSFDVSVWELLWPLMAGACLVLARPGGHQSPKYLLEVLVREQISTVHFVPSMLQVFLEQPDLVGQPWSLKRVICSGEALMPDLLARCLQGLPTEVYNLYGPTEAAIDVTCWPCRATELQAEHIAIGRPIANTQIYLLDQAMQPVPVGVAGELFIGGVQVARGYLEQPDLSAARFVPNPFSEIPARLYRTGDLARYRPDGAIEYLGRLDEQIKLRGYRIEPGEIEALLRRHAAIQAAVVLVRHYPAEEKRLVAYIVPNTSHALPVYQQLRLERSSALAEHSLYELPNSLLIAHQNKSETDFLYQEHFEGIQLGRHHGIELKDGAAIVDVGANIGLFSLQAGLHCRDAHIYAIEPLPTAVRALRLNMALYGLQAHIFACGLAEDAGTRTLTYYPHASILSGSFANQEEDREVVKRFLLNQYGKEADGSEFALTEIDALLEERLKGVTQAFPVRTLSDIIDEQKLEQIDLLKIDVEKSEEDVLRGIKREDWPKIQQIILEVSDIDGRRERIVALLRQQGYDVSCEQESLLKETDLYTLYARRLTYSQLLSPIQQSRATAYTWCSKDALVKDVRQFLAEHLPEYMIPAALVVIESLPLSVNGKIDRKALPEPNRVEQGGSREIVAPRTALEQTLAELCSHVLGVEHMSVFDNFFQVGGHSLLATRVHIRLCTLFNIDLPLHTLFEATTIASLAERIEQLLARQNPRESMNIPLSTHTADGLYPLSFAQERLWFIDQLLPGSPLYTIPLAIRLQGRVQVHALEQSIALLIERHSILRTRYVEWEARPYQKIVADYSQLLITEQCTSEEHALQRLQQLVARPFDLERDLLIRFSLLSWTAADHILFCQLHHSVADGWSLKILIDELTHSYECFLRGQQPTLPALPIQYTDYASWQRSWLNKASAQQQRRYWQQQLCDLVPLTLPTSQAQRELQSIHGAETRFSLPNLSLQRLEQLAQREGLTRFMLLLAPFVTLLMFYSGQTDITIGTPIANRRQAESEGLIGLFVNTLVLRFRPSYVMTVRELLQHVREVALQAYNHQDLPFEQVVEAVQPERDLSRNPLFQTFFALEEGFPSQRYCADIAWNLLDIGTGTAKFDLSLIISESEAICNGQLQYNSALFTDPQVTAMARHLQYIIEQFASHPEGKLEEIHLLSEQEQRMLFAWNTTRQEYPQDSYIHQLFEAQATQYPDTIAIVFEDKQVSYQELNRRANQLAHYLRSQRVEMDVLVGLHLERSIEMIVALLATFKAGGAYVPLDPQYPQERLHFILHDTALTLLLTTSDLSKHFAAAPVQSLQVVCLDTLFSALQHAVDSNPAIPLKDQNLAYVIYTSGSTGQPKGVMLEHRGLYNLAQAQLRTFAAQRSCRILQFASLNFDASIFEMVMAWSAGATLHLTTQQTLRSGPDLVTQLSSEAITTLTLPPSVLAALPSNLRLAQLQTLICAGEACPGSLVALWAAERRMFNAYGPTETTVWATVWRCHGHEERPPIGHPITNVQVYVLDQHLRPQPVGIPGELYIGGAGLMRGYLNRPTLSAERFIPHPYSQEPGERLYKTGDIVRYLPSGEIEYIGRNDEQVKLRGYRIELGEIEAILRQHPALQEVLVVVHTAMHAERFLVVYLVLKAGTSCTRDEIQHWLEQRVPTYMLPAAWMILDAFPLTPNGKIDRRALPAPEMISRNGQTAHSYVPAITETQRDLVKIFEELLHVHPIGIHDDFFALGGHSILLMQLNFQLQRYFGRKLSLAALFQNATIAQLGHLLEGPADQQEWSPLVQLQAGTGTTPFFCVHPIGGNVIAYQQLATHLGSQQAFYGLQAPGLQEGQIPLSSIPVLATHYLQEVQKVQPTGPYLLGGWSFGGLIAYEMAIQLQAQGLHVALLVLLDSQPSSNGDHIATYDDTTALLDFAFHLALRSPQSQQASWTEELLRQRLAENQLSTLLADAQHAGLLPEDIDQDQLKRYLALYKAHNLAWRNYLLPDLHNDNVHLLQSEENERSTDIASQWQERMSSPLHVHVIPGSHYTFLTQPHVVAVAQQMHALLRSAQEKQVRHWGSNIFAPRFPR